MSVFIDTWGWVALGDPLDPAHHAAANFYRAVIQDRRERLTSDFILDETITLLFLRVSFPAARQFIRTMILDPAAAGYLRLEPVTADRFRTAWRLREQLDDKAGISFTDLTSFVIMSETGVRDALTADQHFEQIGRGFRCAP